MNEKLLADLLFTIGTLTGIITKTDALFNKNTQWPRRSSGLNLFMYPITGLLPAYLLDLNLLFFSTLITIVLWTGIFIYRPEDKQ